MNRFDPVSFRRRPVANDALDGVILDVWMLLPPATDSREDKLANKIEIGVPFAGGTEGTVEGIPKGSLKFVVHCSAFSSRQNASKRSLACVSLIEPQSESYELKDVLKLISPTL